MGLRVGVFFFSRERGKLKMFVVVVLEMMTLLEMTTSSVSTRWTEKISQLDRSELPPDAEELEMLQGVPWYWESSALTISSAYSSLSR